MLDEIMEIIKKVGIFLIFGQTLLHLCAQDVYEKYVKMLIGLITAILLISPIMNMIKDGSFQSFQAFQEEYEEKMFHEEADFESIRDEGWSNYFMEESGAYEGTN